MYREGFRVAVSQASWHGSTGMSPCCCYVASNSQFCITRGSHLRQQSQNRSYLSEMRIRKERRMASLYRRCLSNRRRMPGVFRKSPCPATAGKTKHSAQIVIQHLRGLAFCSSFVLPTKHCTLCRICVIMQVCNFTTYRTGGLLCLVPIKPSSCWPRVCRS